MSISLSDPENQPNLATVADLRFHRHVKAVHAKGARAVAELLAELGAERSIQTIIDRKVATYAGLPDEALAALGGDGFPPAPLTAVRP